MVWEGNGEDHSPSPIPISPTFAIFRPMVERPAKTRPRLFLIDGYALIYRAYFAMINRPLTTTYGENTSAAFGFTRFLMMIREDHEPDYLGIVLDAGTSARVEQIGRAHV